MAKENNRYKIDKIHATHLEQNPLNSSTDRDLNIYLPPGYYESSETRYPVIYFLHGYGGTNKSWTMTYRDSKERAIPWEIIPKKILQQIDLDRLVDFEALDVLINTGELPPFILVQPDGSLHVPNIDGRKDFRGMVMQKGSFYVKSPFTGDYENYIVDDIINYIDANYRTIPNKSHRALIGGSMGGYGTLYLCIKHPEKFISAASLSPGNLGNRDLTRINWKLRIPIYEQIFGAKMNAEIGDSAWRDILDTLDLIFSNDNRLLPTIKQDAHGNVIEANKEILNKWEQYDINYMITKNPASLKKVNLLLNCALDDEFGLAESVNKIHETLLEYGITHEFDLYSDPKVALTPHILGIGYHILPAIKFCIQYFSKY